MRRRGGVDLRSVDSTMGFWQGQLDEWMELVKGSVQFQHSLDFWSVDLPPWMRGDRC